MIIDLTRCTGCYSCVEACITENISRIGPKGEILYPDNVVKYARTRPKTVYSESAMRRVFIQCLHCENPPCVHVCPTGASYVSTEGVVLIDPEKCIKCKLCIRACPYGVRTFYTGELPGDPKHEHALKPFIPDKCTFCYHRKRGDGELWVPACVEACTFGARLFGDLDDPEDPVSVLVRYGIAIRPREERGTKPKVFIVPMRSGIEVAKYPARRRDELIEYNTWASIKNEIIRPVFTAATTAAVVLGLIHMIRERRRERG